MGVMLENLRYFDWESHWENMVELREDTLITAHIGLDMASLSAPYWNKNWD